MIVVSGGSGFIGSHLVSRLVEDGHKVMVVDIAPPPLGAGAEFVRASVLDATRLQKIFAGADAIVHLAALVDVNSSVSDPFSDFQVNAQGTINVLEAARHCRVGKVIYASSAAVYGNPAYVPIRESHPQRPASPYGASKLAAEKYVLLYNSLYGMENTALRLFNVYGKGQNPHSPYSGVITKFANALNEGKRATIFGDGDQTRDFVHVDDVCEAFMRAADLQGFEVAMNIASGKEVKIAALYGKMRSLADSEAEPAYEPARTGEISRSVADISLARQLMGYSPKIKLEAGLAELVRQ